MDYKPLTVLSGSKWAAHPSSWNLVIQTFWDPCLSPDVVSMVFLSGHDRHSWWNVHIYRLVYGTHPGFPSLIHTLFVLSFFFSFFLSFLSVFLSFVLSFFLLFFLPSFLHWFIRSFIRSFVRSFLHTFLPSFLHSFSHLCADSSMSLISCYSIGISTTIYSFVDAPHKFNLSLLLHPTDIPVSKNTLWWTNIAIENGHRNSGFSHETWWIFPLLCKRSPEGR